MRFERHEDPQFANVRGNLFISPSILSHFVPRFYFHRQFISSSASPITDGIAVVAEVYGWRRSNYTRFLFTKGMSLTCRLFSRS